MKQDKLYTLVLDLDETLVHYEQFEYPNQQDEDGELFIRPYAEEFLE